MRNSQHQRSRRNRMSERDGEKEKTTSRATGKRTSAIDTSYYDGDRQTMRFFFSLFCSITNSPLHKIITVCCDDACMVNFVLPGLSKDCLRFIDVVVCPPYIRYFAVCTARTTVHKTDWRNSHSLVYSTCHIHLKHLAHHLLKRNHCKLNGFAHCL